MYIKLKPYNRNRTNWLKKKGKWNLFCEEIHKTIMQTILN